jgi:uncharacterized protein with NRDE domain
MCTLAIYVRQFAALPLVVAANRDEFLDRAATPPVLLAERPRIAGGRDLRAGGTWLAVSEHGMVAGLLNRRTADPPVEGKRSRGLLPLAMLAAGSAEAAADALAGVAPEDYNAFNLLVADRAHAWVAQNHAGALRLTALEAGVHVLTNLDLDDPTCPKIARSHRVFADAARAFAGDGDRPVLRARLRAVLADHTTALDPRMPDALGALCVHAGRFGTRCSSLLFLDAGGRWEHWFADGPPCTTEYVPALVP